MNKIRKGDEVIVHHRPRQGQARHGAARVDDDARGRRGRQRGEEARKPNPMKGITGGIVDKTMPIHRRTWRSSTPPPARPTASASSCRATASKVRVFKSSGERDQGSRGRASREAGSKASSKRLEAERWPACKTSLPREGRARR